MEQARESCEGCPDEYDCCKDCAKAWRSIAKELENIAESKR